MHGKLKHGKMKQKSGERQAHTESMNATQNVLGICDAFNLSPRMYVLTYLSTYVPQDLSNNSTPLQGKASPLASVDIAATDLTSATYSYPNNLEYQ